MKKRKGVFYKAPFNKPFTQESWLCKHSSSTHRVHVERSSCTAVIRAKPTLEPSGFNRPARWELDVYTTSARQVHNAI